MKCYISSSCSSKTSFADILMELTELGFKDIELTGNIEYAQGIKDQILKYYNSGGVNFIIHNYLALQPQDFVLNLAAANPDIKNKTASLIKEIIVLSRKIKAGLYTLHPGFRNDLLPELKGDFFVRVNNSPNSEEDFYENVDILDGGIINDGFRVAFENIHPKGSEDLYSFLCTADDMARFLDHFKDRRNIGILLDLGHFNIAASRLGLDREKALERIIRDYKDRIFAFHISENDGANDTHAITGSDSWQVAFLERHKQYFIDTPVTLEWHNCAVKKTFERYRRISEVLKN